MSTQAESWFGQDLNAPPVQPLSPLAIFTNCHVTDDRVGCSPGRLLDHQHAQQGQDPIKQFWAVII